MHASCTVRAFEQASQQVFHLLRGVRASARTPSIQYVHGPPQNLPLAASTLVHATYNFLIFAMTLIGTGGFRHFDKM